MKTSLSAVMCLVFMCLAGSPATAADDQTTLAEISSTLKEIARALKQQAAAQRADLLLKRVTLATTQLVSAQERWKRIDQDIRTLESENGELDMLLASAKRDPAPGESGPAAARSAEIKRRMQKVQDRLGTLRQERVSAENDIETLRREVRDWQTLLDRSITATP